MRRILCRRAPCLLDLAYANAMRKVWHQFPRDADVGALFAESMMDLRPWDLWKHGGKPQPGTPEILATPSALCSWLWVGTRRLQKFIMRT